MANEERFATWTDGIAGVERLLMESLKSGERLGGVAAGSVRGLTREIGETGMEIIRTGGQSLRELVTEATEFARALTLAGRSVLVTFVEETTAVAMALAGRSASRPANGDAQDHSERMLGLAG